LIKIRQKQHEGLHTIVAALAKNITMGAFISKITDVDFLVSKITTANSSAVCHLEH
jgi:hypothetical protein